MNLPDHIHPVAVGEALLNIGMSINDIHALTTGPAPQIICDSEALGVLDSDTILMGRYDTTHWSVMTWCDWAADVQIDPTDIFPLVIIATGAQVRAARTALAATQQPQQTPADTAPTGTTNTTRKLTP